MNIKVSKSEFKVLLNNTSPSMSKCIALTKKGHMVQTGNQHNYDWKWSDEYLDSLSERELERLYNLYKR
jgi:hypothetical protein